MVNSIAVPVQSVSPGQNVLFSTDRLCIPCCCCVTISFGNNGVNTVSVQDANIIIKKIS